MPRLTLAFAAVLILLGLVAFFGLQEAGDRSVTALIPAFFGIVFGILGLLATRPGLRKHAMHGAAVLTLLAMGGTGRALGQLPAALSASSDTPPAAATDATADAEPPIRTNAVIVQSIMFGLSTAFLVACIASFVQARRSAGTRN
jgi:SNF family Na+-dependent transporter